MNALEREEALARLLCRLEGRRVQVQIAAWLPVDPDADPSPRERRVGEVGHAVLAHAGGKGERLPASLGLLGRAQRGDRVTADELPAGLLGRLESRRARIDPRAGAELNHALTVGVGELGHAVGAHAVRELERVATSDRHRLTGTAAGR